VVDAEGQEVAILFADVVGSTQLYEALGDDRARQTIQECLGIMREATEQFGGTVIKTMGDEVMATFATANEAMHAARQMQQRIAAARFTTSATHVAIRVGCHFGPVVTENRDIYGGAVHTANRMTSHAKAGQILTTAATVSQMSADWRAATRQIDVTSVRGRSGEMAVYEVLWQPDEATSMLPTLGWDASGDGLRHRLRLCFQGQELLIGGDGRQTVTLGRSDDNDVVIKGDLISRVHARIELRKNRYVLTDESINGTFVQGNDGKEQYLRRDSMELTGSGVIGMGRVAARGTPLAVEYSCES
jgi:class 3 adenylate cyclase